jgi:cytoplasmic iron level regulating protein YaaA (DUF328/UPF0246 family)|tara:strand:+ start:724 stop:1476 length:753 start_codon:yes stop_codon:yes gene_type:complete
MKILLSPAKKLNFENPSLSLEASSPAFLSEADSLAKKLNTISAKSLSEMMHLSEALTSLNKDRYAQWETAPQKEAVLAFNGDVYLGLNANNWEKTDLEYSQSQIRILSGLYGILKPLDLIKPYRLEMGSKWSLTKTKTNLYKHWGNTIATQLESEMKKEDVIINLASAEYSKVLLPHLSPERKVITAEFKDFRNGQLKMIQIFVKKARGMMAKFIIEEKISDEKDLIKFDKEGYQFDGNLSTENKLVFTR